MRQRSCMQMKESKRSKNIYFIFSIIFWMLSFICLGKNIRKMSHEQWSSMTVWYIAGVFMIVIFVHVIKALRLYVILFGSKFSLEEYLEEYIKTAAVNLLLPFKCGEIYRGLCMGHLVGEYAEGYIVIIFDRFIDTLALITMIAGAGMVSNFEITFTYFVLASFLFLMIVIYCLFMPLYEYWNHFLIFMKESEYTLKGLRFLNTCKNAFYYIDGMVRGRFFILYLLSLAAWGIEVGYFVLLTNESDQMEISEYLSDALAGTLNASNSIYMVVCLTVFLYCGLLLISLKVWRKAEK